MWAWVHGTSWRQGAHSLNYLSNNYLDIDHTGHAHAATLILLPSSRCWILLFSLFEDNSKSSGSMFWYNPPYPRYISLNPNENNKASGTPLQFKKIFRGTIKNYCVTLVISALLFFPLSGAHIYSISDTTWLPAWHGIHCAPQTWKTSQSRFVWKLVVYAVSCHST